MTHFAYYNEIDGFASEWLRELIKSRLIMDGCVDTRSIMDVQPEDLEGFTQHHFFAGIGGWSYALRMAGWEDERPVWTGSCPCQPFSSAGKRKGFKDERHLWPQWFRLVQKHHPPIIFGEQVASALPWYDLVSGDLEAQNYSVGAAIIGAHSVGAPHIRQRLYWMANPNAPQCPIVKPRLDHMERFICSQIGWSQTSNRSTGGSPEHLSDIKGRKFPIEPGTFPLVNGISIGMGRLRGYGNAIVPQVAAAFVKSYMDIEYVVP